MEVSCSFKLYQENELIEGFEYSVLSSVFLIDGILLRIKAKFEYGFGKWFDADEMLKKVKGKPLCLDIEYYDGKNNMVDLRRYDYVEIRVSDEEWFDSESQVAYLWLKPSTNSRGLLWRM